ncbi:MAG: hypothetical protein ABFC78_04575 [Methanoregula sp.]
MSRRVFSENDIKILKEKKKPVPEQDFNQKVVSYIPIEIVTAWTAINGILLSLDSAAIYWIVFGVLALLVPIYIWRFTTEPDLPAAKFQIIGATGAFIAWVFAMGGPFTKIPGFTYDPQYGTIVLAVYAVVLVVLLGKKSTTQTDNAS